MVKKLKNLILVSLSVVMVFCSFGFNAETVEASTNEVKVKVDGQLVDFSKYGAYPKIVEGTTYVPLRSVFEALGCVEDPTKAGNPIGQIPEVLENKNIYVFKGTTTNGFDIVFTVNIKEVMKPFYSHYTVNYKKGDNGALMDLGKLDLKLENGRTFLPLRGISEAFGYEVKWDNENRTVLIDTSNPSCEGMDIVNRQISGNTNISVNTNTNTSNNNSNNNTTTNTENKVLTREEQSQLMLEKVNNLRAEYGLNPLEIDEKLTELAYAKAEDWNLGGYSEDAVSTDGRSNSYHVSPRYGNAREMYETMFGERKDIWENFSKRTTTEEYVTNAFYRWESSEGHLKAMLRPNLTKMGFGYAMIDGTDSISKYNTEYVSLLEMY